jgi:hypothetical protein
MSFHSEEQYGATPEAELVLTDVTISGTDNNMPLQLILTQNLLNFL